MWDFRFLILPIKKGEKKVNLFSMCNSRVHSVGILDFYILIVKKGEKKVNLFSMCNSRVHNVGFWIFIFYLSKKVKKKLTYFPCIILVYIVWEFWILF